MRPAAQLVPARAPALGTALALGLLVGGCRTRPNDCRYAQVERCLWERGVAPPSEPDGPDPAVEGEAETGAEPSPFSIDTTKLDQTLARMTAIIGAGLEWALVDEQARALCSDTPQPPQVDPDMPTPAEGAWTCTIPGLELDDRPLSFEASDGVLALSAIDLNDADSAVLFEAAQRRFDGWCANQAFKQVEGEGLAEFYRCGLAEGPYLVVARFPRDLDAGRWQLSIAIVDAG